MFTLLQQAVKHRTFGWQRNLNRLSLVSLTGTTLSLLPLLTAKSKSSDSTSLLFFLLIVLLPFTSNYSGTATRCCLRLVPLLHSAIRNSPDPCLDFLMLPSEAFDTF